MDGQLFDVPAGDPVVPVEVKGRGSRARVRRPDRMQMRWEAVHLDALLPPEHRARAVWAFVEGLDLSPLYARVKAVEGHQGQPAIDPAILLSLWLYATIEGVGSARAVARLTQEHVVYRWLCGGVGVNYHALSDFRVEHGEVLDGLLTESVAVLMNQGVVELKRVAQDGMRVRASAGAASFRRRPRLEGFLEEAGEQVRRLKKELEEDPGAATRREEAARKRAAEERKARIEGALRELAVIEKKRRAEKEDEGKARASTTDPESRVMKMPDGGFRPAFNVVYAPVQKPKDPTRDPHAPRPGDSEEIAAWRMRMGTAVAKEIYKERAATAECVNALARNRGLRQFLVRGLQKVKAVALLFALAHNMMRAWTLAPRMATAS